MNLATTRFFSNIKMPWEIHMYLYIFNWTMSYELSAQKPTLTLRQSNTVLTRLSFFWKDQIPTEIENIPFLNKFSIHLHCFASTHCYIGGTCTNHLPHFPLYLFNYTYNCKNKLSSWFWICLWTQYGLYSPRQKIMKKVYHHLYIYFILQVQNESYSGVEINKYTYIITDIGRF